MQISKGVKETTALVSRIFWRRYLSPSHWPGCCPKCGKRHVYHKPRVHEFNPEQFAAPALVSAVTFTLFFLDLLAANLPVYLWFTFHAAQTSGCHSWSCHLFLYLFSSDLDGCWSSFRYSLSCLALPSRCPCPDAALLDYTQTNPNLI